MDIKGHTRHKVMVAQASDIAEEYYFSYLLDRANRTFLAMASSRAAWRSSSSPSSAPRRWPGSRSTRSTGVDEAKAAEIVDAGELPGRGADQVIADRRRSCGRSSSQEDATLVEVNPLAKAPDGTRPRARRQGHPGRERRLPPRRATRRSRTTPRPTRSRPRPRRRTSTTSSSTARSASSATAPAWSCRTLDVVAYAGEEHGGVKPANFLDIGGGASAEVMANGLRHHPVRPGREERVRQRLRRHHRLRRGRQRHRRGAAACSATRRPSRWSSGSTATTSRRAGGSSPRPTTRW